MQISQKAVSAVKRSINNNGIIMFDDAKYRMVTPLGQFNDINDIPAEYSPVHIVCICALGANNRILTDSIRSKYKQFFRQQKLGTNIAECGWTLTCYE